MSDFNARVVEALIWESVTEPSVYGGVDYFTVNDHDHTVLNMCKNNSMVTANHLPWTSKMLGGNLSYRKGVTWISKN